MVETRKVDAQILDPDGNPVFQKKDFEVPKGWSDMAANIVASKYATDEENSVVEIIDRVVNQITAWGFSQGYFDSINTGSGDSDKFRESLKDILIDQRAAFNSPVWFNCGVPENNNQMSACFIFPVEDNMEDILQHTVREGMVFKAGSGAGVNVSKLRAKGEKLSNKGEASGPVSFMRTWDACAGSVKSGGKTRRSAKLVCMDVDHPDIVEFIECKGEEEKKAKILMDAGIDRDEAYSSVFFQNANHSIRVSDDFMYAVDENKDWDLTARGTGETLRRVRARTIMDRLAEEAWGTGDPGIQFNDAMNKDNPVPSMGPINSTNPCSEFSAVDNSSCNLASLNLVKYHSPDGFKYSQFEDDIDVLITAMDILIDAADYPTPEVREVTTKTRPLGLGFSNLGAYLMINGIPYDSEEGREVAAEITKNMTTFAYLRSVELGEKLGSYEAFEPDKIVASTIAKRLTESDFVATEILTRGLRNSQLTLLAPTGTISFMMDCDTTGIEPLFALKTYKQLAGGGILEIVPKCVMDSLEKHNTNWAQYDDTCPAADKFIETLPSEKQDVFKTANEINPIDHIRMMAACQKHLNGAISKTVNMPATANVASVKAVYRIAWEEGLKAIAIYRDGSKGHQPLAAAKEEEPEVKPDSVPKQSEQWSAVRRKLPETREAVTHAFNIGGFEGYLNVGMYDDGEPGEIFINMQKQGSTINGLMDCFAILLSFALQYGVPLEKLVAKFRGTRFEPAGFTTSQAIPMTTSIMDYVFRWLHLEFLDEEEIDEDTTQALTSIIPQEAPPMEPVDASGPICQDCGHPTVLEGRCYRCTNCMTTTGCS